MSGNLTSGIARLIEKQLRSWEQARMQRLKTPGPRKPEVEDFICISRMVGVDGHGIAAALGEKLHWPVFGRELLDTMAGDDAIRQRIYANMDQRDLNWWEESLRAVMDKGFVRNDYFRRLCETVLSLARQGNSVFLGRGADLILPKDRGFRVRLIASAENRIESHARTTGMDPESAKQEVEQIERHRAEFFVHRFGVEASDPLRHDLVLNLDRWSFQDAVTLILDARALRQRTPAPDADE
jgi:hypothetical protein